MAKSTWEDFRQDMTDEALGATVDVATSEEGVEAITGVVGVAVEAVSTIFGWLLGSE